jgi:hypothetical protein
LLIHVDGKKAFEKRFAFDPKKETGKWSSAVNQEFSIEIPVGLHAVKFENRGRDWLKIDRYRFEHLLAPTPEEIVRLRGRAVGGEGQAVLGMRGEGVAFLYVVEPSQVRGKRLALANMGTGKHRIEWWDTWSGDVLSKREVASVGGTVELEVPAGDKDIACKIIRKGE